MPKYLGLRLSEFTIDSYSTGFATKQKHTSPSVFRYGIRYNKPDTWITSSVVCICLSRIQSFSHLSLNIPGDFRGVSLTCHTTSLGSDHWSPWSPILTAAQPTTEVYKTERQDGSTKWEGLSLCVFCQVKERCHKRIAWVLKYNRVQCLCLKMTPNFLGTHIHTIHFPSQSIIPRVLYWMG